MKAELKIVNLELEDIITTSNDGLEDAGQGDFGDAEIVIPKPASLLK